LRAVNIGNEKGLVTRLVKKEINDNDEDNPLSVFLYTLKAHRGLKSTTMEDSEFGPPEALITYMV
jgi:hypothetical protein